MGVVGDRSPARLPMRDEECRARLVHARMGRLATTVRALPVILPVAITHDRGHIMLDPFVQPETGLAPGTIVALEVDTLGEDEHGWTVLAQGPIIASHTDPISATDGDRSAPLLLFHPQLVSGWRDTRLSDKVSED